MGFGSYRQAGNWGFPTGPLERQNWHQVSQVHCDIEPAFMGRARTAFAIFNMLRLARRHRFCGGKAKEF